MADNPLKTIGETATKTPPLSVPYKANGSTSQSASTDTKGVWPDFNRNAIENESNHHIGIDAWLALSFSCIVIIHLTMEPQPGTYALILQNHSCAKIEVGRLGMLTFSPGHYIYIGSAHGPGGVYARVSRHCRKSKPRHWHIDYLNKIMRPVCAWIRYDPKHLEHRWARIVSQMPGASPIKRFGSSDCNCLTHLFHITAMPDFNLFKQAAGDSVLSYKLEITNAVIRKAQVNRQLK